MKKKDVNSLRPIPFRKISDIRVDSMTNPIPPARALESDPQDALPIFVGREEEIGELNRLWYEPSVETSVVKIANMPGIG